MHIQLSQVFLFMLHSQKLKLTKFIFRDYPKSLQTALSIFCLITASLRMKDPSVTVQDSLFTETLTYLTLIQ